jgi:rhodanese-related sulfurtransferase
MARKTADQLLEEARARVARLTPGEALAAVRDEDAVLVDIRSDSQRAVDGVVPMAVFVPRNVLEWRMDPQCSWRNPAVARPHTRVIVMCNEGYQSSLAAAVLRELGYERAGDIIGGFRAWRDAGLPVASQ